MDTVITCPNCKTEIPLSDAFKHEIEAGVLAAERVRHQRELDAAVKSAETAAAQKADQEAARREASLRAEAAEEKQRSTALLKQLEEMTTELRSLRHKDEERELAFKRQLASEEERIRTEARERAAADVALQLEKKDREVPLLVNRRSVRSSGSRSSLRSPRIAPVPKLVKAPTT